MDDIRSEVKQKITTLIDELGDDLTEHRVRTLNTSYFVVQHNGEIQIPKSDEFLKSCDFKIALAFPHISYFPDSRKTDTFLKAITINENKEVSVGSLIYKRWHVTFYNQDLRRRSLPVKIKFHNRDILIQETIHNIKKEDFAIHLRLLNLLLDCNTKMEAEFFLNYYKQQKEIETLERVVSKLKDKLVKKDETIEIAKEAFNSIMDIVNTNLN